MEAMNPRVQLDELRPYVGKKVTIGTRGYHYVCGKLLEIRDKTRLVLSVRGRELHVLADDVATIQEAPAAVAEYFK
jgi:hypothetical protein